MPTSRSDSSLRKPAGAEKIPLGAFAYLRAQNQWRAYSLVISELKKSGISKATLARRMGLGADSISKLLRAPRNWTLDTVSDLLFAISGAVPAYSARYPLDRPTKEQHPPHWLGGPEPQPDAAGLRLAKRRSSGQHHAVGSAATVVGVSPLAFSGDTRVLARKSRGLGRKRAS